MRFLIETMMGAIFKNTGSPLMSWDLLGCQWLGVASHRDRTETRLHHAAAAASCQPEWLVPGSLVTACHMEDRRGGRTATVSESPPRAGTQATVVSTSSKRPSRT